METRGDRLKAARVKAGLTQEQVAAHFGVKTSTVSRWEDEADPGTDRLGALARLYGVEPAALAWPDNGDGNDGAAEASR